MYLYPVCTQIYTAIEEINKTRIEQLRKLQFLETEPQYTDEIPFPKFPKLKDESRNGNADSEIDNIIRRMSTNKGIAFDGFRDKVFKIKGANKILENIWDYELPDVVYKL